MNPLVQFPWLTLSIALPLIASILLSFFPPRWAWSITLVAAGGELALTLLAVITMESHQSGFQLVELAPWIPSLNAHYHVGVDGLSALFLPLSALLFVGLTIASRNSVQGMPRLYFALLLMLEGITMGIFCALDTLLFFLFWELTLIPIYFLISLWGVGPHRHFAATKYTLLMLAGGVFLLFGFLLTAIQHGGGPADLEPHHLLFSLPDLLARPLPIEQQWPLFLLLLIGFAMKTPVVPLHTWLPTVAMEAPPVVAAMMTGIKLGAYGLLRLAIPLAPDVARELHWLLAGLGVAGIFYGGLSALVQTNLRRLLAFSSISHVGMVLLGLASFNLVGIQGALLQLLNFTVLGGAIFLLAGFIHHRTGSTDLIHLGGMARSMPLAATFFLLFGLAGLGLPTTSGFPAEQLILFSAMHTHKGAALAALGGQIIGAGYFLSFYRRAFLGPTTHSVVADAVDLRPRERLLMVLFLVPVLAVGLLPNLVLDFTKASAEIWLGRIGHP